MQMNTLTQLEKKAVDVIVPSHNVLHDERYQLLKQQLLLPFDLNNLPNYQHLIATLQYSANSTQNGQVYTVPMVHGPYALIYSPQVVKESPDSWRVLWRPEYKGLYAISYDYFEVNVYVAALSLGVPPEQLTDIDVLKRFKVGDALIDLVRNAHTLWRGVDRAQDLESVVLAASWGFSLPELKRQGKIWQMAEPREGVTGWVDGHSLVHTLRKKPMLKKIAEEWVNFTISKEYQLEVVIKKLGSNPVNVQVGESLTVAEQRKYHLNDPNYFKDKRILWPVLTRRQRNYFQTIWREALSQAGHPTPSR